MVRTLLLSFAAIGIPSIVAVSLAQPLSTTGNGGPVYATRERGSNNWAGYVDIARAGSAFSSVTGTWKVPGVTGPEQSAAAQWIGLGGVRANALLQMGTVETVQNGQSVNTLFWEQLPQAAHDWLSVPSGAVISASIEPASGQTSAFQLTAVVKYGNQSQTYTKTVDVGATYAQQMEQSAEWISEDPSDNNLNLIPLANMGTIQYTGATANHLPIVQADARTQRMALVANNSPNILLQTSALSSGNTSFSTTPATTGTPASIGGSAAGDGSQTVLPFPNGYPQTGQGDGFDGGGGGNGTWIPWPAQNQWQNWQQLQSQIVQQLQNQLQQQLQNAFGSGSFSGGGAGSGDGLLTGSSTGAGSNPGFGNGQWSVQVGTPGWTWAGLQQNVHQYLHQAKTALVSMWSGLRQWGNQIFGLHPNNASPVQQASFRQSHQGWFSFTDEENSSLR